jgi:hypothetical protein
VIQNVKGNQIYEISFYMYQEVAKCKEAMLTVLKKISRYKSICLAGGGQPIRYV